MASEFITRVERDKDEPYTVIFHTDDADKYKHIEDECRKMIGHAKPTKQPTVDAVPVVRCRDCKHCYAEGFVYVRNVCVKHYDFGNVDDDWFCADGERRTQ